MFEKKKINSTYSEKKFNFGGTNKHALINPAALRPRAMNFPFIDHNQAWMCNSSKNETKQKNQKIYKT